MSIARACRLLGHSNQARKAAGQAARAGENGGNPERDAPSRHPETEAPAGRGPRRARRPVRPAARAGKVGQTARKNARKRRIRANGGASSTTSSEAAYPKNYRKCSSRTSPISEPARRVSSTGTSSPTPTPKNSSATRSPPTWARAAASKRSKWPSKTADTNTPSSTTPTEACNTPQEHTSKPLRQTKGK